MTDKAKPSDYKPEPPTVTTSAEYEMLYRAYAQLQKDAQILVEALKKAKAMNDNIWEKGNVNWGNTFGLNFKVINDGLIAVDEALEKWGGL